MKSHNNLRSWREAEGLSAEKLGKLVGASGPSITRIESGLQQPRTELLLKLCKHFHREPADFYGSNGSFQYVNIGTRRLPAWDYTEAPTFVYLSPTEREKVVKRHVLTDKDYSAHAFALEVSDQAMEPRFPRGIVAIIDPQVTPKPNDIVAVLYNDGEREVMALRTYFDRGPADGGGRQYEATPINSAYRTLQSFDSSVELVGVMVEHRTYRGT